MHCSMKQSRSEAKCHNAMPYILRARLAWHRNYSQMSLSWKSALNQNVFNWQCVGCTYICCHVSHLKSMFCWCLRTSVYNILYQTRQASKAAFTNAMADSKELLTLNRPEQCMLDSAVQDAWASCIRQDMQAFGKAQAWCSTWYPCIGFMLGLDISRAISRSCLRHRTHFDRFDATMTSGDALTSKSGIPALLWGCLIN